MLVGWSYMRALHLQFAVKEFESCSLAEKKEKKPTSDAIMIFFLQIAKWETYVLGRASNVPLYTRAFVYIIWSLCAKKKKFTAL